MEMKFDDNKDLKAVYKNINNTLFKQLEGVGSTKTFIDNFNNNIDTIYESCSMLLLKTAIAALHYRDKVDESDQATKKNYDTLVNKVSIIHKQMMSSFSQLDKTAEICKDILEQIPKNSKLLETIITSDLSEKEMIEMIKAELKNK